MKICEYAIQIFAPTFMTTYMESYSDEEAAGALMHQSLAMLLGVAAALVINFIFSSSYKDDLRISIVKKFDGLGKALKACVDKYFDSDLIEPTAKLSHPIYQDYKSTLSIDDEEMVRYARFEKIFKCFYPSTYMEVDTLLDEIGIEVAALHISLSHFKDPSSLYGPPCKSIASGIDDCFQALGDRIEKKQKCRLEALIQNLQEDVEDLNAVVELEPLPAHQTPKTIQSPF